MIEKRTVLILGAGASIDCGFPTGYSLFQQICKGKIARFPVNDRIPMFREQADQAAAEFRAQLSRSGRLSVDAFLETRPDLMEVGKRSIAGTLIPLEREDKLFDPSAASQWYPHLFGKMGHDLDAFAKNQLSVLTFNYDRSLEHFFVVALSHCYNVSRAIAWEHVKRIPIVHLYGSLGKYSPGHGDGRPYDKELDLEGVNESIAALRILTEDADDSPEFTQAHDLLRNAESVIILGFGFLQRNLERLKLSLVPPSITIYASSYGITDLEKEEITRKVGRDLEFGIEYQEILEFLRSDVTIR